MKKIIKYQDFIGELENGEAYGVFIDDTGSPGLSSTPGHLHPDRKSWAGIIIRPDQMPEVLREFPRGLEVIRELTGASEFHFADICAGRNQFNKARISSEQRLGLFRFMAYIFTVYQFPIFVQTFDPEILNELHLRGFPSQESAGPFKMNNPSDAALYWLLVKIKWYLEQTGDRILARVFVDEGLKRNGIAIRVPVWKSVFADGLICFASSSSVLPIQLADFAAFCLNRTQLLLGKENLTEFDMELLRILSPVASNYQNIEKGIIEIDKSLRRIKPKQTH